jgi:hypothetical protein
MGACSFVVSGTDVVSGVPSLADAASSITAASSVSGNSSGISGVSGIGFPWGPWFKQEYQRYADMLRNVMSNPALERDFAVRTVPATPGPALY